jgi:hypothetical protein
MRLAIFCAGFAILLLIYGWSYLLLLRSESYYLVPYPNQLNRVVRLDPEYRFGGRPIRLLFAPAHAVDRMVRPARWHVISPVRTPDESFE